MLFTVYLYTAMPFTDEDRHFIRILCKEKKLQLPKFICEFANKNWSRRGLKYKTT